MKDNPKPDRILIVDDDTEICDLVYNYLTREGFDVLKAANGTELRQLVDDQTPLDIILLDLMLPGEDGLALCRYLSTSSAANVPVLMLTARADDVDRIIGLESGADDYLTKPFVPRELTARIRAILRRLRTIPESAKPLQSVRMIRFGEWRLDKLERCLLDNNNVASPLSTAEYNLLLLFLENSGRVISRYTLMDKLIGENNLNTPFDRAIDLRVSRLRRCLKDSAKRANYIRTIRNEGYLFLQKALPE